MTGMPPFSVWHVTREYSGIAEAGGVKDAVHGLSLALARAGVNTSVVIPYYGFLRGKLPQGESVASFSLSIPDQDKGFRVREEQVQVFSRSADGVRLLLVDSPRFADKRDVYTYTAEDEAENPHKKKGTGHWDAHQMNLILQRAALEAALTREEEMPRIFHCHDGHSAFLPAVMRESPRFAACFSAARAMVTIHNAGMGYHQEIWSIEFARLVTGLAEAVLRRGLLNETVDPLALASAYAPLSTVSENYARELLLEEAAELAGGLGRFLRERGIPLRGITNGIEPEAYDPRNPAACGLPYRFDPSQGDWEGKRKCRAKLFEHLSLAKPDEGVPLFGFIGRLTPQKGIDVLLGAISNHLSEGSRLRFIVLGQGEGRAEERFLTLAAKKPGDGGLLFLARFDPALAKLVYAASDFLLIPSAYEPCGLTDFHAQLLGAIPVVHRVGGLVKVRDGETGFSYAEHSVSALSEAIGRCAHLLREAPDFIEEIRRRAFQEIFEKHTWDKVARDGYIPFYESMLEGRSAEGTWRGK